MRYMIFNWAQDIRYDGWRLFKSKIIDILEFKKYVRLSRAEKGVLSLNYFELNLNSNFWLNLTLVGHAPLATPTEHLRLLWGELVMTI